MSNNTPISIVSEQENNNLLVLRIASASKNSITQCYPSRSQVSLIALNNLHKKVIDKLRLHQIKDVQLSISMQFENDRTVPFNSIDNFRNYDFKTDLCTHVVTVKWSFIFDAEGDGNKHLHTVYVRISERPNPGLIFQKFLSSRTEDVDSLENDMLSPIVCKIDFIDSRFSEEILSVVNQWVSTLPKAEPTFQLFNWLQQSESKIRSFIEGTFPAVMLFGYAGAWLGLFSEEVSNTVRYAVVWMLGGGAIFILSRYAANIINSFIGKQVRRICNVPVFDITSGDGNKITKHLAKTQKSVFNLAMTGFIYGAFQAIGLYFGKSILMPIFFK